MTPTIIVLVLIALGVGIVVWATRRKPGQTQAGPREGDTAWNDPVTPGAPTGREATHDAPPRDPRP